MTTMNAKLTSEGAVTWSRVMTMFGVPLILFGLISAASTLADMSKQQTKLHTLIVSGLEPRLELTEKALSDIRSDMAIKTMDRWTKNDALRSQTRLMGEVSRLSKEIEKVWIQLADHQRRADDKFVRK